MFERQRRFLQQRCHALRGSVRALARAVAKFDRYGAVTQNFRGDDPHQPCPAGAWFRYSQGSRGVCRDHFRGFAPDLVRDRSHLARAVIMLRRRNEDGSILKRVGQIILDRKDQVAGRQAGGEPLRERVQFADFLFAPAESYRLILKSRCEVAGNYGDQKEQEEMDDVLRVLQPETIQRRIEEKIRGCCARKGSNQAWKDSPLSRRHDHRQHVNERRQIERKEGIDDDEADRR